MNAFVLDANGVIINAIVVDSLSVIPGLVDASIGGAIGDSIIGGVLHRKPTPAVVQEVPKSVTRRQARQALQMQGLLANIQPLIDAIPDAGLRAIAQIYWDDAQDFERSNQWVITLGAGLGLSPTQIDNLFITASRL